MRIFGTLKRPFNDGEISAGISFSYSFRYRGQ
jgi:hypothetical protein